MTQTSEKKEQYLSIGAEATLEKRKILGKNIVVKTRVVKGYRNPLLDAPLRRERTSHEAKMLHAVKKWGVTTPTIYLVEPHTSTIYMEYVDAPRLKHVLLDTKIKNTEKMRLCNELGKIIAIFHKHHLIHGDLTTSNVLVRRNKNFKNKKTINELVMIDFGLSTYSHKIEDEAVDLVNLKKTFTATHSTLNEGWGEIQKGYLENGGEKKVLKQMSEVESRIRYA
ncbi:MAG: Kae1-associated serine/threonine protein kinase [Candidatus Diapherotrites archaeon]|uniref:non-specific serine/threonine protein kinase n=1 Tax=Candidatus Iainarchaeum sp. TaxID=3101447 RepID=A0A8T4C7W1_9ARCH|nr:Kae1-associated serine/threonine protein kinase [Candidatus Diapherotrites archaeon]